jgi:hypothetical protein
MKRFRIDFAYDPPDGPDAAGQDSETSSPKCPYLETPLAETVCLGAVRSQYTAFH